MLKYLNTQNTLVEKSLFKKSHFKENPLVITLILQKKYYEYTISNTLSNNYFFIK